MDVNKLFRQKSLERLNSPEELDMLIKQVPTRGWLLVVVFSIITISTVLWGIYGSIRTKVQANGIIMNNKGVSSIYARSTGIVHNIFVKNSDIIKKGDLIALISQPDIKSEIELQEKKLEELKNNYNIEKQSTKIDIDLSSEIKNSTNKRTNEKIKDLKRNLNVLYIELKNKQDLYKDGLVRKFDVNTVQNKIDKLKIDIKAAQNEFVSNQLNSLENKQSKKSRLVSYENQIADSITSLNSLKEKYKKAMEVRAPIDARIVELDISVGNVVAEGSTIVELEDIDSSSTLEVVFFTSALKGKLIKKGYHANISPSIVKKEEYGFIKGKVDFVSLYPASRKLVNTILDNDALTSDFMKEGPPIVVYATLEKDKNTFSGFKWSSSKGPEIHITSGTLCSVEVTVREQAPITLVIPYIKKKLGF